MSFPLNILKFPLYTLWRQVLEYFDGFLIGLTATPAKQTFGFFNKNLVMEYDHTRAVADGVNVDFEVYNICTRITERGSTIEASPNTMVEYRNRQTRHRRWERSDEDLTYDANELDRRVVARDQIRNSEVVDVHGERSVIALGPHGAAPLRPSPSLSQTTVYDTC